MIFEISSYLSIIASNSFLSFVFFLRSATNFSFSSPSASLYLRAKDFICLVNWASSSFALAKPFVFLRSALDGSLSSSSLKSSFINFAFALSKSPLYKLSTIFLPNVSKSSAFKECGLLNPYK